MSPDEIAEVCEVARAHGKRLAAHARSAESVKLALKNGIDVLYHATYIDTEAQDLLEAKRDRVFVAPTLGSLRATLQQAASFGIRLSAAHERDLRDEIEAGIENMKALHRRGVRVLPGGDYGFAVAPIGANARDIELFVQLLGFSPMEAIIAATRSGAQIMDMSEQIGVIKKGFLADLLIVDGDPIEDVAILHEEQNLLAVMKGGTFYKTRVR